MLKVWPFTVSSKSLGVIATKEELETRTEELETEEVDDADLCEEEEPIVTSAKAEEELSSPSSPSSELEEKDDDESTCPLISGSF
jgi:hypothetical protein